MGDPTSPPILDIIQEMIKTNSLSELYHYFQIAICYGIREYTRDDIIKVYRGTNLVINFVINSAAQKSQCIIDVGQCFHHSRCQAGTITARTLI